MRWNLNRRREAGQGLCLLVLWGSMASGMAGGVETLRKSYEEEAGKAVLPLREGYRKALLTLEQSLAAKGDYPNAKRVQEERRSVEKLMGQPDGPNGGQGGAFEADGRLKLTPGGEGSGGVKAESGSWTGWQAAGGTLRWALPAGIKGGGYSLELVYRSAGAGALPLVLKEDFHGLTRSVKVEAAPEAEARVRLGVLRLRPGATVLELRLTGPATCAGFRLMEAHLVPERGDL